MAWLPSREAEVVLESQRIPPHSGPSVHAGDITAETIRRDYDSLIVYPIGLFISPEEAFILSNMGS